MSSAVGSSRAVLERDAELTGIEAAVVRARAGRGSLVVVEGQAGIGKSALIAAARAPVEAAGARVIRARGGELERDFVFGVVRQLLEPVLADAPSGVRDDLFQGPAGHAARLLGLPGAARLADDAPAAPDVSFTVLHGLYWLCANLAAQSPLLMTVDDAHWADVPSLRFLAFLLPRLDELPLALLVATRPDADGAAAPLLAALVADPGAHVLRPAPLSQAAVARLVEAGLDRAPAPRFAAACHQATGGLPFLVGELVAALRDGGVAPTAAAAERVDALGGHTVGRAIRLRLGRLAPPAPRLAEAVAVLESAGLIEAAELAGLELEAAAEAADRLAEAGILQARRPLAFVHPIVRVAVLDAVPRAERTRAHRRAAGLLAARDAADERVAEHLLASEPRSDTWTVERLSRAARTATARGAPEPAATYLVRALAEPPSAASRPAVLLALGVAEVTAGRPEGEPHLREALETARDDVVRIGAALVLAHALGRAERIAPAVEVIDRAAGLLADADGHARGVLEAMALGAGMLDAATAPGLTARLRALRRAADDPAAPREALGAAALVAVHANEPAATCAELARRALAGGPRTVPGPADPPWFPQATIALVWTDRHEEAQAALDAGVLESRRTTDPALFAASHAQRAWLLLRRGDLQGAEADARSVLDAGELGGPALYRKLAAAILVAALTEQGRLAQAAAAGDLGREAVARTQTSAVLRLACGRLRLAQRRPAEALVDVLAAGEIAAATGSRCPGYLPWRSAAALAHAALGEREAALRLADEEVALARAFGAQRTLGVALRAAGVVADGPAGEALLHESAACLERAGVALERARSAAALGALMRRGNRRAEARALLREALEVAHHAGAAPLVDQVETELRATGARPRRAVLTGVEALTASERRVSELAVDGLTNREIAQALFVTMRTVEGHLTSAFAKLGLRSRGELPVALGRPTPP